MNMVAIHSVKPSQEWNHRKEYETEKQLSHLMERERKSLIQLKGGRRLLQARRLQI